MKKHRPRVAFWCPMPPARSGIAEYGYHLVETMRDDLDITVVLPENDLAAARIPDGVDALSAQEAIEGHLGQPEVHLYHIGNHRRFHTWMLPALAKRPGIVVLHDVSLYDLYTGLCHGSDSLWQAELASQGYDDGSKTVDVDGLPAPDRLAYTFTGHVVPPSLRVVVHSQWAVEHLEKLHPGSRVLHVPLAADATGLREPTDIAADAATGAPTTITVLGGIGHHKRVKIALDAFAQVAAEYPSARLVIAGRSDDLGVVDELTAAVDRLGIREQVEVVMDLADDAFEHALHEADLVVTLRWPTAGEMSGVLVKALGAGKPVLTSDVPQFRDLDPRYVHRITPCAPDEVERAADVMRWALENPQERRLAGEAGREHVRANATWEKVASLYADIVHEVIEETRRPATASSASTRRDSGTSIGVNLHGDWTAVTGLAHAARRLALGLHHQGIDLSISAISSGSPQLPSLYPEELHGLRRERLHPIDLWTLNLNEFHLVPTALLRSPRTRRYNIATWYWELPALPGWLADRIDLVDEIWAPSTFVQRALSRYTKRPVHVVPTVVPVYAPSTADIEQIRADLGLPRKTVALLFSFDFNSTIGRKNPLAVIEAFARAFPQGGGAAGVTLIVKAINLERSPAFGAKLRAELDRVGGRLIDRHMSGQEMADLFHAVDIYVSLHRAEGFGLGMAEAMAIGKPVIATGYSGNVDFMSAENSCLVGYQLRAVDGSDHEYNEEAASVYVEGTAWAEPNIDQAASWMQILAADEPLRARIGSAARQAIDSTCSEREVGRIAHERLAAIHEELGL